MGTETKFNCYTEKASNGGIDSDSSGISKIGKGSSNNSIVALNNCCSNGSGNNINREEDDTASALFKVVNGSSISNSVPHVPIHVDENDVVGGAKAILKVIRPNWDVNAVQFKKFTDGITNKLVGCFYTPSNNNGHTNGSDNGNGNGNGNGHTNGNGIPPLNNLSAPPAYDDESSNDAENAYDDNNDSGNLSDSEEEDDDSASDGGATNSSSSSSSNVSEESGISDVVLVRVYGNKTDLLIDRKAETRNIKLMHSYGFAPSLFATFKNGLAYDYVPGVTLNTESVLQPEIWRLVACRMADMHRLIRPAGDADNLVPMLWKKTQSFFDLVPERFSNAEKHKRLEGTFLPISRLREEFADLYKRLESLGSPLVFAHNDLLLGNVVYTESQKRVSFIDYEYADFNFQAFDIGNHFAEFAGVDEVDYARYPNREFQQQWLRVYLENYLLRPPTDSEVEKLFVQVNQFTLATHFFWTIWSLIQAEHSTIDFDYVNYAFVRYNEYLARRDEYLALKENATN